jgi:hypothetical protein
MLSLDFNLGFLDLFPENDAVALFAERRVDGMLLLAHPGSSSSLTACPSNAGLSTVELQPNAKPRPARVCQHQPKNNWEDTTPPLHRAR